MSGVDRGSLHDRFWRKVTPKEPDQCWEWQGYTCKQTGYGRLQGESGLEKIGAHVASYILHFGPVPAGHLVRHKCDNRRCVNPKHLESGTQGDNVRDMMKRGRGRGQFQPGYRGGRDLDARRQANKLRMGRIRTHCKRGHPLPEYAPGHARRCMEDACKAARRRK